MKNKIKDGDTIQLTAPSGGVTSGTPYALRTGATGQVVVPVTGAAEGELFEADCSGAAFEVTAETGVAWSVGDLLYLIVATGVFTKTATSNTYAGVAAKAKVSAAAVGVVQLKRLG